MEKGGAFSLLIFYSGPLKKKKIQPADEAANILSPAICHNSSYDNNNRKRITSVIKHSRRDSSQAKCFFFMHHLI